MFNHFFSGGWINAQSRGIALPALIVAISSLISRLLGVFRDWLLAERFGAGPELDIYYAAFRVPDFIYNILVFGGITVAFLPLFSEYYEKSPAAGWRFANNLLNVFFVFLAAAGLIGFVFAPQLAATIAPGFSPMQLEQTAALTRLMFLSPLIFGVASVFSGILQYFKRFFAYSLAAPLYNLGIIAGIVLLAPAMGIMGVGIGVISGALAYLMIQIIPAVKSGFVWRPIFDPGAPSLKRVWPMMLPRMAGIAANQINLIAPIFIASGLATGSIAVFNLSNNIFSLPVGIIGVSYATASFALFSRYFAENRIADLAQKFSQTFRQIGFFVLPAAILIFLLRIPLVEFLYRRGEFGAEAAALTAACLGVFCLGIYFSAVMPVMFRLFFAMRDTFWPTISTIIAVVANLAMNVWFVAAMRNGGDIFVRRIFDLPEGDVAVLGLALAYGAANILQFLLLFLFLFRKNSALVNTKEIICSFLKCAGAGILAGIALYLTIESSMIKSADNLAILAAGASVFAITYLLAAAALRLPEIAAIKKKLTKR